jgi:hypothetical protein
LSVFDTASDAVADQQNTALGPCEYVSKPTAACFEHQADGYQSP